jgi:hypothetical protein
MNMRASKQISKTRHQDAPTIQTRKLPSTLEQAHQRAQGIYGMRWSLGVIVDELRKAITITIPTGYEDEAGFHLGIELAQKEVGSCRSGAPAPRRRAALFHPFHNCPLGWQAKCALTSQLNNLPSAYLMHRRET